MKTKEKTGTLKLLEIAALLFLAWRIYWTPAPQNPEEPEALPEESKDPGGDGEADKT